MTALWMLAFAGVGAVGECVAASCRPSMYVSASDREAIRERVARVPWAKKAFARIRGQVEPYADRHVQDPQWIVSRLAMYWKAGEHYTQCYLKGQNWDRGEGNAPVPTVRMPGMRTWNKYQNVPLADRTPYNETGDMWGVSRQDPDAPPVLVPYKQSGHMIRSNNVEILTLAENAAFVYWVSGEEKFARFAADIFNTWLAGTYYMQPILDPEKSCGSVGGWAPGGICGYYDYEQIHDDLALHAAAAYDFLYDWLAVHPHPHFKEVGLTTRAAAETVFRRFIEIGLVRGGREGNWNVNGWNIMLRPILTLDSDTAYADGKGREYYLNFLLRQSTDYHEAIPDILANYDTVTGLWPESPGYAFGTVQVLLDWVVPLQRSGADIMAGNPVLAKAAMAAFPWMDERANLVAFGDSRGGPVDFRMFERLLTYYTACGNREEAGRAAAALQRGIAMGTYDRSSADWTGICTFVPELPLADEVKSERMSYSPFHRFIVMKNWDAPYGMMACLYGGRKGSHLTPNGLALQFYGFGYALVPDAAGYESYWSADHGYHQSVTGANTIIPGYTEGEIEVNAMEPQVESGQFVNTEALTDVVNFADVSADEKRRTVALVRTSEHTGYYVDVFRSNQPDNDYLFHHVGDSMRLSDAEGRSLQPVPVERMQKKYTGGYDSFSRLSSLAYDGDFVAEWTLPEGIAARLWMTGAGGRELFRMDAPSSTLNKGLTPGNASTPPQPTPVLLVRQDGNNAAAHPFVGVYEAYRNGRPSVTAVSALPAADGGWSGVEVQTGEVCRDYVFSAVDTLQHRLPQEGAFRGCFGLVRLRDGAPDLLYIGKGRSVSWGELSVTADTDVYASLFRRDGKWYYSATGPVHIRIGQDARRLPSATFCPLGE